MHFFLFLLQFSPPLLCLNVSFFPITYANVYLKHKTFVALRNNSYHLNQWVIQFNISFAYLLSFEKFFLNQFNSQREKAFEA
jgi:hypothetical protein